MPKHNEACGDCVMEFGHAVCTMNCGPAVAPLTITEARAPESAMQRALKAATVVDATPEEFQVAAQALARLDWDALYTAIRVAQMCHRDQFDKGGEPYLWHVLRVGIKLLPAIDAAVAGVLHDVLEDCPLVTEAEVLYGAGGDRELLAVLRLLKKEKGEDYGRYIRRCSTHPVARLVKIADLEDNLKERRLDRAAKVVGREQITELRRKYQAALVYLRSCLISSK